ncbi:hypothetical protein A2480_04155 [Candidatus Uhrbacteria bacterium RIFOXYC2_FULL_47_19]|uniref:Uncharacterized protein n=1 Tax=Candidatus Uhrbacteria bacterium RIFOXYC2_FULL_47_19 TaxID=1802424 RepID=A0A1F7WCW6_9BACT|nr:MAG: hypothetical protein A2480_04155 [Candidatus Uhrbacteria bacterium RIFOXYC2_FULL_47_19]HCC22300.1 hypothetical protein [Candidatus Uhrbacteria bacterium]
MRLSLELIATPLQLATRFSVPSGGARTDRQCIEPGSWGAVIRDSIGRNMELMRWGKGESRLSDDVRLSVDVRIEDLVGRHSRHLLERRLLAPVSSFVVGSGSGRQRFRLSNGDLLALAGVWDVDGHWRGRPVRCFRIITGPGDALARLPLVLQSENERIWLDPFATDAVLLDALEPINEASLEIS